MRTLSRRLRHSLVFAISLAAGFSTAAAQCVGPDNLSGGPCCAPAVATLPNFGTVSLPGLGICWLNCVPSGQNPLKVSWGTLAQTACGQYTTLLTVADGGSGLPVLTGKMLLDYTRTWEEQDPSGQLHQVWRFAAKADLSFVPGSPLTCPVPNCLAGAGGPHPTAFYYGYVDYTALCGTIISENAIVLHHQADFFIHRPGLSDRPGQFHPQRSLSIVAPHSSAQPFVPAVNPAPSGPLVGEATRDVIPLLPPICMTEDRILQGQLTMLGGFCLCPPAIVPKQNQFRAFAATLNCPQATGVNGSFQAMNIGFPNTLPWFNLVTSSIGTWTNPNVYPGNEGAWVDEGLFVHQDACTGPFVSIDYGGTTRGGWQVIHPLPINSFTDIADNYTSPLLGPYTFPIFGSTYPTDRLIYVNTP